MHQIISTIEETGILARAFLKDEKDALSVGKALLAGDLPVLELFFTGEQTFEAVKILSAELPGLVTGIGGLRKKAEAEKCISSGAGFLSSFRYIPEIDALCREKNVCYIPTVQSATEIDACLSAGVDSAFLFISAPSAIQENLRNFPKYFPEMRYILTGNISKENLAEWMANRYVHAASAEWITENPSVEAGQFDKITRLSSEAVLAVHNFGLLHIGINNSCGEEAIEAAAKMSALFGFPLRERPNSLFAGLGFEFMKTPDLGKNGHIAIGVNDIPRAAAYLRRKGISTLPGTERFHDDGTLRRIYLDLEISEFAFHLRTYR